MKKIIQTLLISFVVLISFILISKTNFNLEENIYINEDINENVEKINIKKDLLTINVKNEDLNVSLPLEEYLIGVVSCEMPANYNIEALKAQAVAARTFILNRAKNKIKYTVTGTTKDQCYRSNDYLKKKWNTNYNKYYNKIKKAVNETKSEVLTYKGNLISTLYFSMSNGYTENSENVFVSSKPYLVSVSSMWDKENSNFEKTISFTDKEIIRKLDIDDNIINEIKIIKRFETNRVKEIKVNNHIYTGVEFRKLLDLRSTDFDIVKKDNKYYITTRGYGHGVGMSQVGANALAKEGNSYEDILKYYYKNVELIKYK